MLYLNLFYAPVGKMCLKINFALAILAYAKFYSNAVLLDNGETGVCIFITFINVL